MDPTQTVTLNRLLQRLDHTLLSADADPKLRYSQYERNRVGINVEKARTLLLSLEKQSASVRSQLSQKQQIQADLQQKRELVKQLNAKLEELNRLGEEEEGDVDSDSDEQEESNGSTTNQPSYAPARLDADNGLEANVEPREMLRTAVSDAQQQANQQEMRSRKPLSAADNRSAASTTAREELFADVTQPLGARRSHKRTTWACEGVEGKHDELWRELGSREGRDEARGEQSGEEQFGHGSGGREDGDSEAHE
jgi:hypothetical protein